MSLKRDGTVVVNTGNLLHSFSVQLETLGSGTKDQELGCHQQQVDFISPDADTNYISIINHIIYFRMTSITSNP